MLKGLLASSSSKSPDHWVTIVADLEARMAAVRQRIDASSHERVNLAQAAAGGDADARSRLDHADSSDKVLWAEFDRLHPALTKARAELHEIQNRTRNAHRRSDMAALRKSLIERLKVVAEVENMMRALAQDIGKMARLAEEARQHLAALSGDQADPAIAGALTDAEVANRLLGFALRLGVIEQLKGMQPGDARPLDSLLNAENEAQLAYVAGLDQAGRNGAAS